MVQLLINGLKYLAQIGKVHHPTGFIFNLSLNPDFNAEGMAVEASTFVAFRDVGQAVSRLTYEDFRDFNYALRLRRRALFFQEGRLYAN